MNLRQPSHHRYAAHGDQLSSFCNSLHYCLRHPSLIYPDLKILNILVLSYIIWYPYFILNNGLKRANQENPNTFGGCNVLLA